MLPLFLDVIAAGDVLYKGLSPNFKANVKNSVNQCEDNLIILSSNYRRFETDTTWEKAQQFLQGTGDTTLNLFSLFPKTSDVQTKSLSLGDAPEFGGHVLFDMSNIPVRLFVKNTSEDILEELKKSKDTVRVAYCSNLDPFNENLDEKKQKFSQKFIGEADVIACRTPGLQTIYQKYFEANGIKKDVILLETPVFEFKQPLQKFRDMSQKGTINNPLKIKASCYPIHWEGYLKTLKEFAAQNKDFSRHLIIGLITSGC